MKFSLLDDPLITVRMFDKSIKSVGLPKIYPMLINNEIMGFEALQPHQHQPWYSFLVQLGAMTITRETNGEIPNQSEVWKEALIRLANGNEAAWHLVVDDISQPAFMQPPIPEGSLVEAKYKSDIQTPDELDMLVTSKNHDLKMSRITNPAAGHWLFSLLTLQTMEGFLGAGNYGIVRMNGGFGHRPFVGVAPGFTWGARTTRDIKLLVKNRHLLTGRYRANGHALLWTIPWDGEKKSALPLEECDPFFIEICRRIRFYSDSKEDIICCRTNTKSARIFAVDELNGRTDDPWTPIEKKGVKALTLGAMGFTYNLLQELLLGTEYQQPLAMQIQNEDDDAILLITQALIRGQGKTDGLHARLIPIPPKGRRALFRNDDEKKKLARRAKEWVDKAATMQSKVLQPALRVLLNNGEHKKTEYNKIEPWIKQFNRAIDQHFFDALWSSINNSIDEAHTEWEQLLLKEAEKQLKAAERSIPVSSIRQWKAVSNARGFFYGNARKHFDYLYPLQYESTS